MLRARDHTRRVRSFARLAGGLVMLTGGLVLLGWALDGGVLKTVLPGYPPMVPVTAIALTLAGGALCLLGVEAPQLVARRGVQAVGVILTLLGASTLGQYLFGWRTGLGELFFRESLRTAATPWPGRPAFLTALNLVFLGPALVFLDIRPRLRRWPIELLILIPIEISLLALLGYACNVPSFYGRTSLSPNAAISLPTATAFVILGTGLLCARPDRGLMKIVTSASAGGVVARRLLLAPVFIPLLTGLLGIALRKTRYYNADFVHWSFSFLNIFVFTAVIWWIATLLHRTDDVRQQNEQALREAKDQLEARVCERTTDLQAKESHSQALLKLAQNLELAQSPADILRESRRVLESVLGFRSAWFYLATEDQRFLTLVEADDSYQGRVWPQDGNLLLIEGDPMLEEIAAARDLVVVEDARTDPRTNKAMVAKLGNRTIVNMPITLADKRLGAIGTGTFGEEGVRKLSEAERDFFSALARQVGAVLDRVQASERRERAEEALRKSEERFSKAFQASPATIAISTYPEGLYVDVNEHFTQMLGYSREEVLGRRAVDLGVYAKPEQRAEIIRRIEAGQPVRGVEYVLKTKSGHLRTCVVAVEPIVLGDQPCLLFINHDITERKEAEEALKRSEANLQLANEAAELGDWSWDMITGAVEWSARCRALYGLPPETVMTYERFLAAVHPADREKVERQLKEAVATRSTYETEKRVIWPDGSVHWNTTRGKVFCDAHGTPLRMVGVTLDITARKGAEAAVRRLNAELEQRVLERTAQLEAANLELEAFSHSVSHDLRAPLRHVEGFVTLALEEGAARMDPQVRDSLQMAVTAAHRMQQLIDDLLGFAKTSRAEMNAVTVNLDELIRNLVRDAAHETSGRKVQWNIQPLPPVTGDLALLRQVFVNLVSNALKFTRATPQARIEIGARVIGKEVEVFVRDNGAGFDMRYVHRLFGVFQRLHSAEQFEGTGIGLANVQRIVHRHGGRVWAEGRPNEGATFYVLLPKAPS